HQHELPVDPRQMNPDVPDEVAAVVARMMAKNPRDRYQKPEHLVEHLLRVAQKVEAGTERADGLLYVDAPLPTRPTRPLILGALAIAAVVTLVFTLEQPKASRGSFPQNSRGTSPPEERKDKPEERKDKPSTDKPEERKDVTPAPVAVSQPRFEYDDKKTLDDLR